MLAIAIDVLEDLSLDHGRHLALEVRRELRRAAWPFHGGREQPREHSRNGYGDVQLERGSPASEVTFVSVGRPEEEAVAEVPRQVEDHAIDVNVDGVVGV